MANKNFLSSYEISKNNFLLVAVKDQTIQKQRLFYCGIFKPFVAIETTIPQATKVIKNFSHNTDFFSYSILITPLSSEELFHAMMKIKPEGSEMNIGVSVGKPSFLVDFTVKVPSNFMGKEDYLNYFIQNTSRLQTPVEKIIIEDIDSISQQRYLREEGKFNKIKV